MHLWFQWSQLNDMVTIWCAVLIEGSGSVLVSFFFFKLFFNYDFFFRLPTWPWREPFLQSKETGVIHTGNGIQMIKFLQRNNPFLGKRKQKGKKKGGKIEKKPQTQHLPHSQSEVLLKKWIKKILSSQNNVKYCKGRNK